MINPTGPEQRRALAPLLAAVMVVLSVDVPVLDSGEDRQAPVWETEHHSTCVTGHDHTICTQVGANFAFAATAAPPRRPETEAAAWIAVCVVDAASADRLHQHPPRAPPAV